VIPPDPTYPAPNYAEIYGVSPNATGTTVVFPVHDKARIGSKADEPNFQAATAPVNFGTQAVAKATLIVDLASTCFPFETRQAPPAGQRWPADCDAFDRNFDIHLDAPSDAKGRPGIELVHAITPFGGPQHLEVDVTDIVNGLPGTHTVTTRIATWSDPAGKVTGSNGGWTVSARIEATLGKAPRQVLKVQSLVNTNISKPEDLAALGFETPEGATSARLEVRTSGHGGGDAADDADCIGPADEFCERQHTWAVDGAPLSAKSVWRTDCSKLCTLETLKSGDKALSYCKENPCGAVDSVRAPRANWCPGSETPAFTWTDARLATPGSHTLDWKISKIGQGGLWAVSATYFAFKE
jgi:hypothetical protein